MARLLLTWCGTATRTNGRCNEEGGLPAEVGNGEGFVPVGCVLVLGHYKLLRKNVVLFLCVIYLDERGSIQLFVKFNLNC